MKQQHTPGPWKFEDEMVISFDGQAVADPYCMSTQDTIAGEMEANARLIAAAPDLMAACRAVLDAGFRDFNGDFILPHGEEDERGDYSDSPAVIAMEAAIAKATDGTRERTADGRKLIPHDGVTEWSVCGRCGHVIDWASDAVADQGDTSCPVCGYADTAFLYDE